MSPRRGALSANTRVLREAHCWCCRDRLLLATSIEIVIQTAEGHERRVPIPPNHGAKIHRAGEDTVQIELSGSPSQIMRIKAEGERLYELPAAEARP